ncbi:Mu-like prophage major head subunit gpT family protein [Acinetobacter nectaris]|uniref:Mu-like prophage major head subunit gpT family protein n=1 Tax=Acinetobacter nectaris TaxID=1219382 RepID=UPI001F3BD1B7|nr:Mu-like prophage major head subunit gpT family protein [Acinetobacter nectaris]MCF9046627.1 Mu-like prophage major head subunit gpT family protein [Acinetobacter nectaris]
MIFNEKNASAVITALATSIKTIFNNAFDAAPSQWNLVAMEVPSNGKSNSYAWIEKFPKLRKWLGDKVISQLSAHAYTITNDDFEATVEIDRNDIEDDNIGIYKPQAQMAGESSKQWADDLVFTAISQGFHQPCYDGKSFYATNHEVGAGKGKKLVSNKLDVKLDASSLEAARNSYGKARTMIRSMKDNEGRPLNLNPNILLVPPALEDEANVFMTVDRLEDGKPNPYKGTATVVVAGWLETDSEWHLLDASKAIKPIIFQPRKQPVFVALTDTSSDSVFNRKKFKFGAEARGAAGYGLWQMAVGSTGEK